MQFWFDDVVPGLDWADDVTRLELRDLMARQLSLPTTGVDDDVAPVTYDVTPTDGKTS